MKPSIGRVAVVGTGVIGRSWIQVFARAGCEVRAFDASAAQRRAALGWFEEDVADLVDRGEITAAAAAERIRAVLPVAELSEAVAGVGWVQESGPEDLGIKRTLYAQLDRLAPAGAILASSTSAIDMTEIAADLRGAARCVVAHPVNPPHVIPAVEVLGGTRTDPDTVERAIRFLGEVGQTPVRMNRFVPGFLLNRMQAALVREAVDLVATGVADADAVDAVIRDGLGLRWALMGPFGVANTNADGGVREYFTRFRAGYHSLWDDLGTATRFSDELVERLGREVDAANRTPLEAQRRWRDRMVASVRKLRAARPDS